VLWGVGAICMMLNEWMLEVVFLVDFGLNEFD
jgi:hypothetical protein